MERENIPGGMEEEMCRRGNYTLGVILERKGIDDTLDGRGGT